MTSALSAMRVVDVPWGGERDGRRVRQRSSPVPWLAPTVAAALALVAGVAGWHGVDLPAQLYRVGLFHRDGLVLWDSQWYGGHWTFNYSVIFPPVAGTLGIQFTAILSAAIAAFAFDRLVVGHFGTRARTAAVLFAVGTLVPVAIGQLPFLLGESIALCALLSATRQRWILGVALALGSALASPLAAGFLGLALVAWLLAQWPQRRLGLAAMAAGALGPILAAAVLFPGEGNMPFPAGDFAQLCLLFAILTLVIPRRERALRIGVALYALAIAASFVVTTPLGGNISRLGEAIGAPLAVCLLWPKWRSLVAAAVVLLVLMQWTPAFAAFTTGASEPSRQATYFAPLLQFLAAHDSPPGRVEVVPLRFHWESAYVAPRFPLARGWERQLDTADNSLFYSGEPLTAPVYTEWLRDNGVRYVALADTEPDYAARAEARLLGAGVAGLAGPVRIGHWRVFELVGGPGLVQGPADLLRLDGSHVELDVKSAGTVVVRVRYDRRWTLDGGEGCVTPTSGGWTEVHAATPGPLSLTLHLVGSDACR